MQELLNTETVYVTAIDKQTDIVFICFNGLTGTDIDGVHPFQLTEFKSVSKLYTTIFIVDKTMSWGNHVDWDMVKTAIQPVVEGKTTISVGLSMGGFNAIVSSSILNVDKVISFNSQYSIHKLIAPDKEYNDYANKIRHWNFKTFDYSFTNNTKYYMFVSEGSAVDKLAISKYPDFCHVFNFGDKYEHNIPAALKREERLQDLFNLVIANDLYRINEYVDKVI
jgi:hypothetical protein